MGQGHIHHAHQGGALYAIVRYQDAHAYFE